MERTRSFPHRWSDYGLRKTSRDLRSVFLMLAFAVGLADPVCGMDARNPPIPESDAQELPEKPKDLPLQRFLDLLMLAESGGRLSAKNPRSTALGPFQFIESTFLEVARRYFPDEVAGLSDNEILVKRTDPDFARRAAHAYTMDNATYLTAQGVAATSVNLRLAFLVGPAGAVRLLTADADTPVAKLLSSEALAANPFMASMTAADLIRKAALDLSGIVRVRKVGRAPGLAIRCKLSLPSCRRWVALRKGKVARPRKDRTQEQVTPARY